MKRFFLTVFFVLASLLLVGSFALWLVLSAWVPTKGKAVLIQEAERRWPVTLSIGTVRYDFFQGFLLTNVQVSHRPSSTVWAVIPAMQVQPEWVNLALLRTLAFRGRVQTDVPVKTTLAVSGRYHLDKQTASVSAQADEIGIKDIGGLLAAHLPPQLADGRLRAQLHLNAAPGAVPTITGRVIGTNLRWDGSPWHLVGALTVNGSARPPAGAAGQPWSVSAVASLNDATLTDVPVIGSITRLEGTAKLFEDRIEALELSGDTLGSRWRLEGDVNLVRPSLEALVTSRVPLASLAGVLPLAMSGWGLSGEADARAVCRGPLTPRPWLDCLVQASLERAAVEGPKLAEPVTGINGTIFYDVLAKRLTIQELSGTLRRRPLRISGSVSVSDPLDLALAVDGTVPLDLVQPWLPAAAPVTGLTGEAACDLTVDGRPGALQILGRLTLQDASATLASPALQLTRINGEIALSKDSLDLRDLALVVKDQPLTLEAVLRPPPLGGQKTFAVTATAGTPQADVRLAARVTPEDLLLDSGEITFSGSKLEFLGTVSRHPERASRLNIKGQVELEEIGHLPFVSWPALERWKLAGPVELDTQFQGRWADWPSAVVRARLGSPRLSIQQVPVSELVLLVEQNNRVLRASVPTAAIAGGRAVGELVIEHQANTHRFLGQSDLTGIQLEQLAAAIPAWRESTVRGQASGRVLLSGTWEDRATWRGEGWLNSSGEHLGELPLLEKVFQRAVLGTLADLLGLEPLRRAKITQASLTWKLADEWVHTQDLRLAGTAGIGAVVVYLQGKIGLDQRLDLAVQPEFSEQLLSQSRALAGVAEKLPIATLLHNPLFRYHISGTLKDPKVERPSLEGIMSQLLGGFFQNLFGGPRAPDDPAQVRP